MKRIKILIAVLVFGMSVQAQFSTPAELRAYIDQYINNNAINAFTNKRLNTALKGIMQQVDSANSRAVGGVRVVDTLYMANDSTIVFKIKNNVSGATTTYSLPVHTSASDSAGIVYNEGLLIDITGTTIKVDTAAADARYTTNWKNISGTGTAGSPFDPKQYVASSVTTLRSIIPDVGTVYRIATASDVSDFVYDPSDVTSLDDSVMVIRSGAARYKRVVKDHINLQWFGAVGDNSTDCGPAVLKALTWMKNTSNKSWTLQVPSGQYAIYNTVDFNFGLNITVNMIGEAGSGGRLSGSTFIWHGTSGLPMFRFQSSYNTRYENMEFVGRNGSGSAAKNAFHFQWVSGGLTSLINFSKCAFGGFGGDSSAIINFNASGGIGIINNQADESTFQDCTMFGNAINSPDSLKTWWIFLLGGNNTKNFNINHNHMINATHAVIKGIGGVGRLSSNDNIVGTSDFHFDLTYPTTLVSKSDYCESNGAILKTPVTGVSAGAMSVTLIGYESNSANFGGELGPLFPVAHENVIEGQGTLILQSCLFNASSHIPRIDWITDIGNASLTVIGCKFTGVLSPGLTPFYSSGNPLLTGNRESDYGRIIQHHVISLNNLGADSTLEAAYAMPNASTSDFLFRGFSKTSAYIGRPTASMDQKRWYDGDRSIDILIGDASGVPRSYECIKSGTFKTISVTATATNGSATLTAVSDISQLQVGDMVNFDSRFNGSYPYTVMSISGNTFTVPYPAGSTGSVTITNAVPVFKADGSAVGASGSKPTLTANDKGYLYFNTDDSTMSYYRGSTWTTLGSKWTSGTGSNIFYNSSGNVGIGTGTGSVTGRLSFGGLYDVDAINLYEDGTDKYGWGIRSQELQSYVPPASHWSWNINADGSKTSGTNEKMRLDATGLTLNSLASGSSAIVTATSAGLLGTAALPVSSQWTNTTGGIYYNGKVRVGVSTPSLQALLSMGDAYDVEALNIFESGSDRYGWGIRSLELQNYMPTAAHFSWNFGVGLQTSGTNEIMRADAAGLKLPAFAGSGVRVATYNASGYFGQSNIFTSSGKVGIGTGSPGATLDLGSLYDTPAFLIYNDGSATNTYGGGIRGSDWQMFFPTAAGMTWNHGGALQAGGTNQLMKLTTAGLNVPTIYKQASYAASYTMTDLNLIYKGFADSAYATKNNPTFTGLLTTPHVAGSGPAPGIAAGTGAGTGPTISMMSGSTDLAGEISILTGTSPASGATICTMTYNVAYATNPFVVFSPSNAASADVNVYVVRTSATQFQLAITGVALTAATTYKWTYKVTQ